MNLASLIISIISLATAIWAASTSKKASDKVIQISMGELEKSIRDLISQTRKNMEDKSVLVMNLLKGRKPSELEKKQRTTLEGFKKAYASAVEGWLNAYEEACAKYLDEKIDKDRFRRNYKREIRYIVETRRRENKEVYELIHPEGTSHYQSVWGVYREWENVE